MRYTMLFLACAHFPLPLRAQVLSFPNPVSAGTAVPITIINDTGTPMVYGVGETVAVLVRGTGERIAPHVFISSDQLSFIPPGGNIVGPLDIPPSGAGSQGSFLVIAHVGEGAVRRIDVGGPSATFPAIHPFPRFTYQGFHAHQDFGSFTFWWSLANSSNQSHTFSAGDRIDVMNPGTTTVVATLPLSGISVGAGKVTRLTLPTNGLTPGPYTVQVTWTDPVVGLSIQRDGIRERAGIDMHLPSGKNIPLGGRLDADLFFDDYFGSSPLFVFLVGFQPGSLALPGGVILPLAPDPLMIQSFGGLGGLITNGSGTPTQVVWCFCFGWYGGRWNIELAHPGPIASGITLRAAALAFEPGPDIFGASQPEEFLLQ